MDIERASTNTLFQPGRQTPGLGYFLLCFTKVETDAVTLCLTQNTGNVNGPLQLPFDETGSDAPVALSGEVQLSEGDWKLIVYEQASSTNLNPSLADREVWHELIRVSNEAGADDPAPYDPCEFCECPEVGESCPIDLIVNVDGVEVATQEDIDPCEDNTVTVNITYS